MDPQDAIELEITMQDDSFPLYFGEWLTQRRKALDLTRSELAQRAGCSVFTLRKIESGERRPSKQLASLMAFALEISPEEHGRFVRVARGEFNLESLRPVSLTSVVNSFRKASTPPPLNNLPVLPKRLVGRENELAAMERIFHGPYGRLLTLTGPGGIGKTHLAVEFASHQLSFFPGGVYYVPLASLNSANLIVPAIAAAMRVTFSGHAELRQQLIGYIAVFLNRDVLLILDNIEHLLATSPSAGYQNAGAADLVSEILQCLPNVKILVTSRERLNLQGEWTYELHGLPVPPADIANEMEDYGAVRLFIESAQQKRPDFQVTAEERSAIIQICRFVGGIPLAIELSAAWVGVLSCEEIAREVESSLDLLTSSVRDIPERHRSIRATFDHSWNLLTDQERCALCKLSVFHGGFDRSAAKHIASAPLPLLASLVSKSLVRRAETGRYDLHEVIRQYASAQFIEDPQSVETRDRHCDYYLTLLRGKERVLRSANQQEALRELIIEIDNLRAAWGWAIERRRLAHIEQAVRSFAWLFEIAGLLSEGIEQLEHVVQTLNLIPQTEESRRLLGRTLAQQSLLLFRKGQFEQAAGLLDTSLVLLRPFGDPALLVDALIYLGTISHLNGDLDRSQILLEEGLVSARAGNDSFFETWASYNLGYFASLVGNHQQGYEQMMAGLSTWRTVGDPHYIALGLNFLIPTMVKLGRHEEARQLMQESLMLCEDTGDRWGMGTALRCLGLINLAQGNLVDAESFLYKSLETFRGFVEGWDVALALVFLGETKLAAAELQKAEGFFLEALHVALNARAFSLALEALAGLALLRAEVTQYGPAFVIASFVLNQTATSIEARARAQQIQRVAGQKMTTSQLRAAQLQVAGQSISTILEVATVPLASSQIGPLTSTTGHHIAKSANHTSSTN